MPDHGPVRHLTVHPESAAVTELRFSSPTAPIADLAASPTVHDLRRMITDRHLAGRYGPTR